MRFHMSLFSLIWLFLAITSVHGEEETEPGVRKMTWKIGSVERSALVYLPKQDGKKKPVIFAFHGHGGNSLYSVRKFAYHTYWPDAICIYPQGLPSPAPGIDPDGKLPGWQNTIGELGDRDLLFFDSMLKDMMEKHRGDDNKVFVSGHSHGGFFTYLLACARGEKLAGIAPMASAMSMKDIAKQKPLPTFHVAGEADRIVSYSFQKRVIDRVKTLNSCSSEGKEKGQGCIEYASSTSNPLVTFIHKGGHEIPSSVPKLIIEFWKPLSRKPA